MNQPPAQPPKALPPSPAAVTNPAEPVREAVALRKEDVYQLTDEAMLELHGAQTSLSATELELLVLVDGYASVDDIARRARTLKSEVVEAGMTKLLRDKLISIAAKADSDSLDFGHFLSGAALLAPTSPGKASAAELDSGQLALQKQGFYVRIARRPLQERKLAEGQKLQVLIVEDEHHLAKLLRTFLSIEGYVAHVAGNREEILEALRSAPRPDLVLLDVVLPDADGFQVLDAMRRHPALKAVPVIMLTAKDNRDAVLKGLTGGATGYITKPFDMDVLMKAVRTVLGLPEAK